MSVDTDMNISPKFGTKTNDTLYGTGRSEVFSGRQGDDTIYSRSGSDEAFGGSGDDLIYGERGNDILYGGGGPSYANMGNFVIAEDVTGIVTFINEGAGYRNSLGMYKIDEAGNVYDVQILFANASKQGSGGDLIPGESTVEVELSAGDQLGFFVASNAFNKGANSSYLTDETSTLSMVNPQTGEIGNVDTDDYMFLKYTDDETGHESYIQTQYGYHLFHSPAYESNDYAPNPDDFPHTVGRVNSITGEVMLGFEDLYNGGDKDYDDSVFTLDVGVSNARVLDPNIHYDEGEDDIDDVVDEGEETPVVVSESENDDLYGGSGNDELYGMAGNDDLYGGDGNDLIYGNSGDDFLSGGSRDDEMHGGKGNDTFEDGSGNDVLDGNSGDDLFICGTGNDDITGGSGFDTVDFRYATGSIKVDLHGHKSSGLGNDTLDGIEAAVGTSHADHFKGDKRDNTFWGNDGADFFRGLGGDDTFYGGDGSDTFYWRGKDILRPGTDQYSVDTIKDFTTDDILDFSDIISGNGSEEGFAITDWLSFLLTDDDVTVSVDFDGDGSGFTDVCVLEDTGDLDLTTLYGDGNILV